MTPSDLTRSISDLWDAVLLVELQGTVVAANAGASRLFQRPSLDLVGKPLSVFHSVFREQARRSANRPCPAKEQDSRCILGHRLHRMFADPVHSMELRVADALASQDWPGTRARTRFN